MICIMFDMVLQKYFKKGGKRKVCWPEAHHRLKPRSGILVCRRGLYILSVVCYDGGTCRIFFSEGGE